LAELGEKGLPELAQRTEILFHLLARVDVTEKIIRCGGARDQSA